MDSWWSLPRGVRWLLFANVLTFVGIGMTAQYSILFLTEGRAQTLETATTVLSLGGLVGAISTPIAGWFVDRFGGRVVALVSTIVWAASVAAYALIREPWALYANFALASLATNVRFTAFGSGIGLITPPAQRGGMLSLNFAALNLGIGIGGLIAGYLLDRSNPDTYTLLYVLQAIGVASLLLFVHLLPAREARTGTAAAQINTGSWGEILSDRKLWVLSLLAMLLWLVISQQNYLLPLLATNLGVSTQLLGQSLLLNTFGIALLQMPMYRLVSGWPRTRVTAVMFGLMMLGWGAFALGVASQTAAVLAIAIFATAALIGIAETLFSSSLSPTLLDIAPRAQLGRYNGVYTLAIATCNISAPLTTGVFVNNGLGLQLALVLMALCAFGAFMARHLPRAE